MKNKRQVTVLATVAVTFEYDERSGLDDNQMKQEVKYQLDGLLVTSGLIQWFSEIEADSDCVVVPEVSVKVNTVLPTSYKYN